MRANVFRSAAMLAATMALGGCLEKEPEASLTPPDYSPNYTKVTVLRPDGRTKSALVPEACLTPDDQSPADEGEKRLPPGCANNYNLQRMAERKRDLVKGRPADAAPAAPAARAAQNYIDGRNPVLGGGVRYDKGGSVLDTPPSASSTPVPAAQ